MRRRDVLLSVAGAAVTVLALPILSRAQAKAQPTGRPNFVFIFADDVGWGDLSCYGQTRFKTPRLDKLAHEGTLFTQFYVSGSVCSPSRTAIMTGHFPARHGVHGHFAAEAHNRRRKMPNFLDPTVPTVTRTLQANGYVTGHFGKWHLGHGPGAPLPEAYGIDRSKTTTSNDPEGRDAWNLWKPEFRPVSTKMVLDETLNFIKANKDKPFYVNAWLHDTHATLNPSEEQLARFQRYQAKGVPFHGATQVYYATMDAMDRQIGAFLDQLDALGLTDNTVVIFSSDNGPEDIHINNSSHSGVGSAGPFRGRKRSIYEGGIRVPFIVRWPKRVPTGKVDDTSVIAGVDFYPTICRLAGIPIDVTRIDGEDRSACLLGKPHERTKPLMWEWRYRIFGHVMHMSPMLAIRQAQWKLLLNPDRSRVELYDIPADPREMDNLAKNHPRLVEQLTEKVLTWQKTLPESPLDPVCGQAPWRWPQAK